MCLSEVVEVSVLVPLGTLHRRMGMKDARFRWGCLEDRFVDHSIAQEVEDSRTSAFFVRLLDSRACIVVQDPIELIGRVERQGQREIDQVANHRQ